MVRFERAVVGRVPVTRLTRPLVPAAEHQSQVISVLIDSGPTEDTDENMELRLWKQAEADLRRLDRVDARLSRALDIVRAERGAASNYKEKIRVLQHNKISDADGNSAQSYTMALQTLSDEDGNLDQLRQDLRTSLVDVQVSTPISSPACQPCLSPPAFITICPGSGVVVNGGNCPFNSQTIQSGADMSRMQYRSCSGQSESESVPNAETTSGYSIDGTFGADYVVSMECVDLQREVLPSSEAAGSEDLGTRLNFHLLNGSLRFALEGVDVNTQPYAIVSGMAKLSWRGRSYILLVNDEVRAA